MVFKGRKDAWRNAFNFLPQLQIYSSFLFEHEHSHLLKNCTGDQENSLQNQMNKLTHMCPLVTMIKYT